MARIDPSRLVDWLVEEKDSDGKIVDEFSDSDIVALCQYMPKPADGTKRELFLIVDDDKFRVDFVSGKYFDADVPHMFSMIRVLKRGINRLSEDNRAAFGI